MLTSFGEYWRDRDEGAFQGKGTDVATGILCPSCGLQEIHANLQTIVNNKPPQHPGWCVGCGWNGYV